MNINTEKINIFYLSYSCHNFYAFIFSELLVQYLDRVLWNLQNRRRNRYLLRKMTLKQPLQCLDGKISLSNNSQHELFCYSLNAMHVGRHSNV